MEAVTSNMYGPSWEDFLGSWQLEEGQDQILSSFAWVIPVSQGHGVKSCNFLLVGRCKEVPRDD